MSVLNFGRLFLTTSFVRLVLVFVKFVLLIPYLQPVPNPPFDIRICIPAVSLAQNERINTFLRFRAATTNISYFPVIF